MTPEGEIKKRIKASLAKFCNVHAIWPVPYGYGKQQLDCVLCVLGRYIAIEAKAPGKPLSELQINTIKKIKDAHGVVFVIDGTELTDTIEELESYLRSLNKFIDKRVTVLSN